jgi:hypothetical protein
MLQLLPYLQTFLAIGNVAIMVYALKTFLAKPHDTLEARVQVVEKRADEHDLKFKELDTRLHEGNDNFREQKELNTVFINCMLAFIDFEIAFCAHTNYSDTEDLLRAKKSLQQYLSNK